MKLLLTFVLLCLGQLVFSQSTELGIFQGRTDVGNPRIPGSIKYDNKTQKYLVGGSGQNIWGKHDDFHFVWKKMKGNFILNSRHIFKGKGTNAHRKTGWMVRQTLEPNSPYADAAIHGDGLASLQFRRAADGETEEIKSALIAPDVVQLERRVDALTMSAAKYGEPLEVTGKLQLNLGNEVYVGLFISSHEENVFEQAEFSNVRITVPAKENFVAYRDYSGSSLEILEVSTGDRKIIYSSPDPVEAPNWTRDGSSLIFNSKGFLYRLPLNSQKPVQINTDFAKRNNNDHVLSFDGKYIGISNHGSKNQSGGESLIFVLPATGGLPQQVTQKGPSYLHGWSPDRKTLVYCAEQNGKYDVYAIPVTGGEEKRLTEAEGLDDGPEYSPDGKYIYFNSNRTGSMQIWRMKPDGSNQEQLTNDDYNNWFAHISPDGKKMIFLSFNKEVPSGDHPYYKQVTIRLRPVDGKEKPRVLAYLYGGQVTVNVPSWSPDSKRISFFSYSFPDDYFDKNQ